MCHSLKYSHYCTGCSSASVLKTYGLTACCSAQQQSDLATDIGVTLLWSVPYDPLWSNGRALSAHQQHRQPWQSSAAAPCPDCILQQVKVTAAVLQLKPIKQLRRFSIFIQCSIYLTSFFFFFFFSPSFSGFHCLVGFFFPRLFLCLQFFPVVREEVGSAEPGVPPLRCLPGCLFIALLSLICRDVESFATLCWGPNLAVFTARQNSSELVRFLPP